MENRQTQLPPLEQAQQPAAVSARVAFALAFFRNEISSNLHVFEMCSLDQCAQSCRKVFSYVVAIAAMK